jgi:hypothetical protein
MKSLLVALSGVACSVVIGILLGYSVLGLTPLTCGIALGLSFLLPLILILTRQRQIRLEPASHRWIVGAILIVIFLAFAVRQFGWLIFVRGDQIRVLSPNNLGDICLHLTHINYLASNPSYWPENPIFAFDKLRYPIGLNLFNAELKVIGIEPRLGTILVALAGSLLTLRALFLFNGSFAVASFLFNGGLAGFVFFKTFMWQDYQGEVAWKSIPLALFVTQRGLLYAVPAGLLLLRHWYTTLFERRQDQQLPFWAEFLLYSTMPLFHLHTFLFLSFLLLWWFLFGDPNWRGSLLRLVGASLVPATLCVYAVTGFSKTDALAWYPGWMARETGTPAWWFWFENFGLFLPACLALSIYLLIQSDGPTRPSKQMISLWFFPSAAVFVACALFKFAPWAWDNTKLFFWAYLLIMFTLWKAFLSRWHPALRAVVCFGLFFSGFISLAGSFVTNQNGFQIGSLSEWQAVDEAMRSFPAETVFAAYPTYNHPALVNGHRLVLGFPGHLWSHGLDYRGIETQLTSLMQSDPGWEQTAADLGADCLFWGRFEEAHYSNSKKEWESKCRVLAEGDWGRIYDLRAVQGTSGVSSSGIRVSSSELCPGSDTRNSKPGNPKPESRIPELETTTPVDRSVNQR